MIGHDEPGLRSFTESDVTFALEQTAREGWDNTRELFEAVLAHEPDGSFVAEIGGRHVGMVTTTRYQKTGWIGNLIVEPGFRRRGLGECLMRQALGRLEALGVGTVRLEADPLGIGIYRRLGFVDEFESPRLRLEKAKGAQARARCAAVRPGELSDLADLDAAAFGDRRERLLALLLASAIAAFRVPGAGPLTGYLLVQRSAQGVRLGPWVAPDREVAEHLLATALASVPGGPVVVATPGPNRDCQELLRAWGFAATPSSLRMVRGRTLGQGHPERVYGLASGAVG